MSNISEIMRNIMVLMSQNRRSGTSTLIKNISKEHKVLIVVAHLIEKNDFGETAVSLSEIRNMGSITATKTPVLFDNHAVMVLAELALREIINLQEKVSELEGKITKINRVLTNN